VNCMDLQTYKTTAADLCVRKPRVEQTFLDTAHCMDLQTTNCMDLQTHADLCERKPQVDQTFYSTPDLCERKPRVGQTYRTFAGGVVAALAARPQTKTQNSFDALGVLTDDADALLGAVSGGALGVQVVEAIVDSGAVHSVTPPDLFPGPTVPSPWSRAGRGYRAANGTGIKNLGQVTVKFATAAGDRCSIPFQVAEVEQPLLSVAHLTSAGNRVELGHTDGRVVNTTTGRTIALERRGGVYIMKMYIAKEVEPAPFGRQGA
jgi:hypothetical protein